MPEASDPSEAATAKAATDRLTFFSDAVVAIAITLLAIDLPLPVGHTNAELWASLQENALDYLTFLISFAVIGDHWYQHHRTFRYVVRADGPIVPLNLLWLLLIVINPFLTRVLNDDTVDFVRFGLYALAQTLQLGIFALMVGVLIRRGWFAASAPTWLTAHGNLHRLIAASGFAVSIPLFLLIGTWAFAVWAFVPMVVGRLARRLEPLPRP